MRPEDLSIRSHGTRCPVRRLLRRPAVVALRGRWFWEWTRIRDAHVAAVLSATGTVPATDEFPATAAGYRDLLKWARKSGAVRRAGVEGTGTYGASLSRCLLSQGVGVSDVNRRDRADRRRRGSQDDGDPREVGGFVAPTVGGIPYGGRQPHLLPVAQDVRGESEAFREGADAQELVISAAIPAVLA